MKRPKWTRLWVLQRWWWQAVAPGLMSENRNWQQMYEKTVEERNQLEDRVEELEDKNVELSRKNSLNQDGYWHIQSTENSTSCYRLDERFVEWYSMWCEPIQTKFEFLLRAVPRKKKKDTTQYMVG